MLEGERRTVLEHVLTHVGVMVAVETETLVDEDLSPFAGVGWGGLPAETGQWIGLGRPHP